MNECESIPIVLPYLVKEEATHARTHLGQRWSRKEEMETWMVVSFRFHESDAGGYLSIVDRTVSVRVFI